jgi:hypothetical protein
MSGELNPNPEVIKKKRGRKKKEVSTNLNNNITIIIEESNSTENPPVLEQPVVKKRGRKPKGGKLITKPPEKKEFVQPISNVILHLKCSMLDLVEHNTNINKIVTDPLLYNPVVPPSIMTYNSDENNMFSEYKSNEVNLSETKEPDIKQLAYSEFEKVKTASNTVCQSCSLKMEMTTNVEEVDDEINMKDVNAKLKKIKLQLYKNSNPDKKSACFWCTYEYDNPPCYIPKYEMDEQIYGYGSFCRPECAVSYLMKENIDDSTKFERYHLLNQIYSKVYEYKKNIKPAPNPYFLLDKFYGNLSIQEYRKLLKTEHMLLVIDKPMTRILPELHEDSEDFIMNIYGGKSSSQSNQSGVYKVKKQSEKQKGPSKNSIMKENFGLAQ